MTRGKIDQVETKTSKNGREFRRVKVGNSWLSCWDAKLFPLLVAGAELDYETQDRQGFANLTAATAGGPPPSSPGASGRPRSRSEGFAARGGPGTASRDGPQAEEGSGEPRPDAVAAR